MEPKPTPQRKVGGPRIRKKQQIDENVLTMARMRISKAYDTFDNVIVSFSGGKDSTVVLNLTLEEAERRGRLPLTVVFWDEEAIQPDTIDYVTRIADDPRVAMKWFALPITHRNGCSRESPYWQPWDPKCPELWTRPFPTHRTVITHLEGFANQPMPETNPLICDRKKGTWAVMVGIRADESLRRMRSVLMKVADNHIAWESNGYIALVKPIYDWTTPDVWRAPALFGWDTNYAYDRMDMLNISRNDQRVAPPYGEEPMRGLWIYKQCWPELWDKMSVRVPGASTAARYSQTELYGFGKVTPLEGMDWIGTIERYLQRHPKEQREFIAGNLAGYIENHRNKTTDPIPMESQHPVSGISWRYLAMLAQRGDLKGRRVPTGKATADEVVASVNEASAFNNRGSIKDRKRRQNTIPLKADPNEEILDLDADGTRY